tara:strand:+ start:2050 stop:3936 length:1887 start_codon:yes stop_codon:yes gene_type:complete
MTKFFLFIYFVSFILLGQGFNDSTNFNEINSGLRDTQTRINLEADIQRGNLVKRQFQFNEIINANFGLRFFLPDSSLGSTFDNLPIPGYYEISVGDEIRISLWGQADLQEIFIVDKEGRIFVRSIGFISVIGKSLTELKQYLKQEFSKSYSTLYSDDDRTFMDVSMVSIQSVNLQVIGEVVSPGVYNIHPFSNVITAISQAGGIDTTGSIRNIKILRDGNIFKEIDFYKLLVYGENNHDFRLKNKDIILVDKRQTTIQIDGQVNKPGFYEMKKNENFDHLLRFCGDFKPKAGLVTEVTRILSRSERLTDDDAIKKFYFRDLSKINFSDGDKIVVPKIKNTNSQVYAYGQVKNEGNYRFVKSMRIYDLLELAGGINDKEFLKSVNTQKIDLIRRDITSNFSQVITLDLEKIINKDENENILLENYDQITVYPNLNFLPPKTVNLFGEINFPGIYPILKDNETILNIINRAGGLSPRAYEKGIILTRNNQRVILEGLNNVVRDGDQINVPQISNVVEIKGEVFNPGLISFKSNRKINQYLQIAGGLTPNADLNNILVYYVDGSVKIKKRFSNINIEPGCIIQIYEKVESTNLVGQILTFVEGVSNTITQIITTYVIVTQIGNVISGNSTQ